MKVTKTNRGFELINFKDYYNKEATLQESSGDTRMQLRFMKKCPLLEKPKGEK